MTDYDLPEYMPYCATEILIYVFSFLKPKHLLKCRLVCSRWKLIVDSLCKSEILWRRNCRSDFAEIYQSAYYKRKPGLSWRNLYRSLTLWSKLQYATETSDEFAPATRFIDEIRDFQVLRGGEIGIHTRGGIVYYDIKTLQRSNRQTISGNYLRYIENEEVILILGFTSDLYVIRKILRNPRQDDTRFASVKNYLLHNNTVYFVTFNNEICMCDLLENEMTSVLLIAIPDSVICLGYKNGLHILTYQRTVYTIVGKEVTECSLDDSNNLLHDLNEYNFLENLDWRVYFQWLFVLRHSIPQLSIRDIIVAKVYGHIVFVGTDSGVFRIYHSPYLNDGFDLFNSEPVMQYNFSERSDCPVLALSPILQIDVIEGEDCHTVLVCMPKKIAILKFTHETLNNTSECSFSEVKSIEMSNLNNT